MEIGFFFDLQKDTGLQDVFLKDLIWITLWLQDVTPDASKSCGPYKQAEDFSREEDILEKTVHVHNHDTIGIFFCNCSMQFFMSFLTDLINLLQFYVTCW